LETDHLEARRRSLDHGAAEVFAKLLQTLTEFVLEFLGRKIKPVTAFEIIVKILVRCRFEVDPLDCGPDIFL